MGIGAKIKIFFIGLFDKVGNFLKQFWAKAEPALEQILGDVALLVWKTGRGLMIEAIEYVAAQGLPTDKAKQDAFKEYMKEHSELAIDEIKDNDFAILRDLAYGAWKKAQENK